MNLDLVKRGIECMDAYDNVTLTWVKAHTGNTDEISYGNAQADMLATSSLTQEVEEVPSEEVKEEEVKEVAEIFTFRKKEYYTIQGDPEKVIYEVLEGDLRGKRLGVWVLTKKGNKKPIFEGL